jgi:hypothetical protein
MSSHSDVFEIVFSAGPMCDLTGTKLQLASYCSSSPFTKRIWACISGHSFWGMTQVEILARPKNPCTTKNPKQLEDSEGQVLTGK